MEKISLLSACLVSIIAMAGCTHGGSPAASADAGAPGETEVSFPGAGGFTLKGALTLPAKSPAPALLLLPGSGPTDRDGNQPPQLTTDVLKQIAERLAKEGIATLRFDKRAAHVYSGQWPQGTEAQGTFFSWENFVADAQAAYKFMRQQKGVDPARCGFLGHSEGGTITLAATKGLTEPPAALVLVGTPGRTAKAVLHTQIEAKLKEQGATPDVARFYLGKLDSTCDTVINTGTIPGDVPQGLQALFPPYIARYMHSWLGLEPLAIAARYTGPVLVMNGENDIQVSPTLDAKPLAAALKARAKGSSELFIVPGSSHCLKLTANNPAGFTGPVAPAALDKLAAWTKASLASH